ncbi:MAG: catalase family peroxidase [Actinomycetota bacterium]|nr:catalase family peroxidase [Actinomycetota bacterium]
MATQAERIIEAMNAIHGVHPGFRAVHSKGVCCRGTFTATQAAAELSVAPHLQGGEVPVTVRFSNGSGRPTRADGARDERGMAVKFHLLDGVTTDIVSLTLPVFFVRSPEDFLGFLEAQRPDPETGKPNLARVEAFVNDHPETQTALGFAMFSMAPASYANCNFHGIHAFKMTGPGRVQNYVRYHWIPAAGEATLEDEETRRLGRNYLRDELETRLRTTSVEFELRFQIAGEGDDPTDPTIAWPEDRRTISAGTLSITEFAGVECEPMVFDPGRVIDGIERSDDPILHARTPAYSVSHERRTRATSAPDR